MDKDPLSYPVTATDDEREEFTPRRPRLIRCRDRMCGADDCPNCRGEAAALASLFPEEPEIEAANDPDSGAV